MNDLIEIENINKTTFNYNQLDNETSIELQNIANSIDVITSNFKYLIGEQLYKAQELLSKKGYGCFTEWIESYNLNRQTAYNYISYYKVFVQQLDKQNELKKLSDRKVYALGRLNSEQQNNVLENLDLKKMSNKEVDNLTKQLKAEQEYSQELQDAIKQKEEQIRALKIQIENTQKPEVQIVEKEIVKEIISEELISKKKALEEEVKTLRERASKAEIALKNVKLESKVEKDNVYYKNNLDLLQVIVKEFLEKASKYTYFREEYQNIPTQKKKFIESNLEQVKNWVMLMEQAINNRQDVVGNIIYGEGEIINE